MVVLSKRLQKIADKVNPGDRIADIGTDHALLPVFLTERGIVERAIASEVNDGPLQAAERQVSLANVADCVQVRKGDGLEVLKHGEVDTIIIAGMGGALISTILDKGKHKLHGVKRLILQPNIGEEKVRRWLHDHNWLLIEEEMVKEDGNIYEILVAEEKDEQQDESGYLSEQLYKEWRMDEDVVVKQDTLFLMGPYFVRQPTMLFIEKWERELHKLQFVLKQLEDAVASSSEAMERKRTFQLRFQQIKEVIHAGKRTLDRAND